ncbi:hypothetical protein DFJ74DRAFT_709501 [Hyaloraphidium curvatum]|nr:hypothetical protein DFJ74DRAFT_709501 [Hyaloraphidium curvatum]
MADEEDRISLGDASGSDEDGSADGEDPMDAEGAAWEGDEGPRELSADEGDAEGGGGGDDAGQRPAKRTKTGHDVAGEGGGAPTGVAGDGSRPPLPPVRRFVSAPQHHFLRLRLTYPAPPPLPTPAFFKKALVGALQAAFGLLGSGADLDVLALGPAAPPRALSPGCDPPTFDALVRVRPEAATGVRAALTLVTRLDGREVRVDVVERGGWLVGMGAGVDSSAWLP